MGGGAFGGAVFELEDADGLALQGVGGDGALAGFGDPEEIAVPADAVGAAAGGGELLEDLAVLGIELVGGGGGWDGDPELAIDPLEAVGAALLALAGGVEAAEDFAVARVAEELDGWVGGGDPDGAVGAGLEGDAAGVVGLGG